MEQKKEPKMEKELDLKQEMEYQRGREHEQEWLRLAAERMQKSKANRQRKSTKYAIFDDSDAPSPEDSDGSEPVSPASSMLRFKAKRASPHHSFQRPSTLRHCGQRISPKGTLHLVHPNGLSFKVLHISSVVPTCKRRLEEPIVSVFIPIYDH
jgi:hypothetical protein